MAQPPNGLPGAENGMPFNRDDRLRVRAEAVGTTPKPWVWAIYRGTDRFLITRSRPEYRERDEALEAGLKAAADVGRRLHTEVVAEEAERAHHEPV